MAKKSTTIPFDFKVGDWCKSYEKGFFRIEQIVPLVVDELDILRDQLWEQESQEKGIPFQRNFTPDMLGMVKHRMVISKRLLNSKFKRQIGVSDCCGEIYIKPIKPEEKEKLEQFIKENPKVMDVFENSVSKSPETRYGFSFSLSGDEKNNLIMIAQEIQCHPMTTTEFYNRLDDFSLVSKMVNHGTYVQGVTFGEFRDGRVVFSKLLVHGFSL